MAALGAQQKIASEVGGWAGVEAVPHRFGGVEFRLGKRELGHVHGDYWADIPFPMAVRDQLVATKRADPHHILPHSGWVTFRFRSGEDIKAAVRLFRLSYDIASRPTSVMAAVPAPPPPAVRTD